ncbi:MAG: EI24 domain-containing protein [Cyanobacteria bacterium J06641_5]
MKRFLGGFGLVAGAIYPLRALNLLVRSPQLWSYLAAPILLNSILGGFLYIGLQPYGRRLQQAVAQGATATIAQLPDGLKFLDDMVLAISWLLQGLLVVGLFLAIGLLLVQFGTLLGSPFYGKLSEQVEQRRTGALVMVEVSPLQDLGRATLFELKKLAFALPVGALLFGLQFLPGLGTAIAGVGGIALSAMLVGLDFLDGALERRRLRFRQKLAIALGALPASGSFSLVCLILVGIPILNFLTIPLCGVAGTLFVCDRILPRLQATQ